VELVVGGRVRGSICLSTCQRDHIISDGDATGTGLTHIDLYRPPSLMLFLPPDQQKITLLSLCVQSAVLSG